MSLIKLRTNDGEEFEMEEKVVRMSEMLNVSTTLVFLNF